VGGVALDRLQAAAHVLRIIIIQCQLRLRAQRGQRRTHLVRGLGQTMPHVIIPQIIGALLGRYYFEKKLGLMWGQYVPVLAAGVSCGFGLISMLCIGIVFLAKSTNTLVY
jgi:hypothetical protein